MKRVILKITLIMLMGLAAPQVVTATKFVNYKGAGYEADSVYNDDVFLYGYKVKFDSKVYGDLFAFSYEMVQSDTIAGDFMAFAYSVQNLAPVDGSFRVAGRNMSCNSRIGRNLLFWGQQITVGPQADIGMNADLSGNNVVFQGNVKGDLNINARTAVVFGNIGGNLTYQGDSLTINPNTIINGNLNYSSPAKAIIGDGSTIKGNIDWKKTVMEKPKEKRPGGFWSLFTWVVSPKGYLLFSSLLSIIIFIFSVIPLPTWLVIPLLWITFVICGNILIALTKPRAWATEDILKGRFLPSLGLGFILFFGIPIVAFIMFLTVFLAPLSAILIMLFGVAMFAGWVYASMFAGRQFCRIFNPNAGKTPGYLCFTIGMALLVALMFVPYLGYLIMLAALMAGLGGLTQTYFGPNKGLKTSP